MPQTVCLLLLLLLLLKIGKIGWRKRRKRRKWDKIQIGKECGLPTHMKVIFKGLFEIRSTSFILDNVYEILKIMK